MEELTTAAYNLLKSYVLPGKTYDIVEALALQMALAQQNGVYTPQLQIHAMKSAVTAVYEAQIKVNEEYNNLVTAKSPAYWDRGELESEL